MSLAGRIIFCTLFTITWLFPNDEVSAQQKKYPKITDEIGLLAGANIVLFYPKDINKHPINGGDPQTQPDGMFGLSYYHAFSPRWAHIFQIRMSDHQIKYWKATSRSWYYNHETVTIMSDSGDYHIQYRDISMDYMFGWCLNKKIGWNFYGGIQIHYTINNQSSKNVDGIEYGKLVGFEYTPYAQPLYYYDKTSKTYSPYGGSEVLFRTDVRLKMGDQWTIRPALEYGFDPGNIQEFIKERMAFYLEVYYTL